MRYRVWIQIEEMDEHGETMGITEPVGGSEEVFTDRGNAEAHAMRLAQGPETERFLASALRAARDALWLVVGSSLGDRMDVHARNRLGRNHSNAVNALSSWEQATGEKV